jgi:hypothetical protein
MDVHELEVLKHYTANGRTSIAMIPQYAVPPGEQWSIDFVGIDFERKALLYVEVSSSQRPSARTLDKMRRRQEWIPVIRQCLTAASPVINDTWTDFPIMFVVDPAVASVRRKLGFPTDLAIEPLSRCYPEWLTTQPYRVAEPRPAKASSSSPAA